MYFPPLIEPCRLIADPLLFGVGDPRSDFLVWIGAIDLFEVSLRGLVLLRNFQLGLIFFRACNSFANS